MDKHNNFIDAPSMPEWPEPHQGLWLTFGVLPPLPLDSIERVQMEMIRTFWQQIRVVPTAGCSGERGTTWLELFILFSIMGGKASEPLKAHLRQTHDRLFKAFRKGSKQLFRFASAGTRPLLKASINREGSTGVWLVGHKIWSCEVMVGS